MVDTTTTTTTATTTNSPLPTPPMSLPLSRQSDSTNTDPQESTSSPDSTMTQFTPEQCLFCPKLLPNFTGTMAHMQKSHGLFIPHQQHLAVDLEALCRYLHLIISGYQECIRCGTRRATVQGVQQHMTGKGHCNFDISQEDSEFAEFYDLSEPEDASESEADGDWEERNQEETAVRLSQRDLPDGQDSMRLPSGKIISRHPLAKSGPSSTPARRRARTYASRLEQHTPVEAGNERGEDPREDEGPREEDPQSGVHDIRLLSRRERREKETVTYQLASMSASDRDSLVHLPASQQRAILAAQFRNKVKTQKEERRRQGKVDRKGNKNLYAYWNTETPVYQCG